MSTFSIVIPAYNEESGISEIIQRVLAIKNDLAAVGIEQFKLLVVDDGSSDHTGQITEAFAADNSDVELIQHPQNKGYGAALKTGFCHAESDLIGFLDADGTYPPELFPKLCESALNGSDLVIGSRMSGADSHMPLTRRVGNFFFANLLSVLGRRRVSDSASGMRVFRRDILNRIYPLPDGLNLTPVMSTRAIHEGISMTEVPIPYSERVGRSKLSVVRDGSIFLRSMIWTALSYNPVRILGLIGFAGMVIALLAAASLIVLRLQGVETLQPLNIVALYVGAVSGFIGVTLYALGVTFNYLVSLFHKRPVQQGITGKSALKTPVDRHFGWIGLTMLAVGTIIGSASLLLGFNGWDMNRLWLYGLGSAMLILTGVQLFVYWIVLRVLEELSVRDLKIDLDLKS